MTLYDDALKIKRKGIHDDFEKYLSKIENESDIKQLRKLLELAEKAGADLQALTDELTNIGFYQKEMERIKKEVTDMNEKLSSDVQRVHEKVQSLDLQRVEDQVIRLRSYIKNEDATRDEIIKHAKNELRQVSTYLDHLQIVIVVGTILIALMFRMWILNCYGEL